jgi:cell division protein FtsW
LNPWDRWARVSPDHSFYAFGSGGLTGLGLGKAIKTILSARTPYRLYFPSSPRNWAFWGSTVALLFLFFMVRSLRAALKGQDLFGLYLAAGITIMITLQAFINMLVVMGLLPTKGLTLPFISYGGSNLLAMFTCVGILFSIARHAHARGKIPAAVETDEIPITQAT